LTRVPSLSLETGRARASKDGRLTVCLVGLIAAGHSGVPRYALALTRALDAVSHEFPRLRLSLLTTERAAAAIAAQTLDVHTVTFARRVAHTSPARIVLEQLALASQRADLLHFFDLTGPLLTRWRPFITTVHDAASAHGFTHAYKLQFFRRAYKRRLHPWAIQRCTAAIADSEFAKAEAVRHFGADPAKVAVVHCGPGFMNVGESLQNHSRVPMSPYVLFVGNLSANKNLPFLVRAFGLTDASTRLVLAGRPGYEFGAVRAAIDMSPARERIDLIQDVSDAEVDALYRSATALVLPSLYEGFGFTALEAMARGCPVLASDIPSIREVSGTGAELLPPDDEAAWADALGRIVDDESLRAELKAKGLRTASRYRWDTTARKICEVFESVGSKVRERN
jgi:glycosyltransferase involved in cell wall biosynthesis